MGPRLKHRARIGITRHGRHHVLTSDQWVPAAPEACFAFFSDAGNLEALTPPFLHFHIVTPRPIAMRTGALIDYRLRLLGLPLPWRTLIEEWHPGHGFTDRQLRGPYARWVHRHAFVPVDGGTWLRDEVEYALPLVPLSDPVHVLFVRPRLHRIFAYRRDVITRLLG